MKLSVIIPFYSKWPDKHKMLADCMFSLGNQPDEIIVIGNTEGGLPWSINKGLSAASGDFLLLVSDDMVLARGSLDTLCIPGVVTHPMIDGIPQVFGGCVCYPREVYEAVGDYDEGYKSGYFDDDDYFVRVNYAGYERWVVSGVDMFHDHPGTSLKSIVTSEIWDYNKQYFQQKWGESCQTPLPTKIL